MNVRGPHRNRNHRLCGEVDIATVGRYRLDLSDALDGVGDVIIDVSALTFIDSAGIAMLAPVIADASRFGRCVVLRGASASLRRLLAICGLEQLFDYH